MDKSENRKYLINECITIQSKDRFIRDVNNNVLHRLLRTSHRGLIFLLDNYDNVVPYNKLMVHIWGEEAEKKIPMNTMYQCLNNMRKSLVKCGLSVDFIKTIPSVGLLISAKENNVVASRDQAINELNKKQQTFKYIGFLNLFFLALMIIVSSWFFVTAKDLLPLEKTLTINGCSIHSRNDIEGNELIINQALSMCVKKYKDIYIYNTFTSDRISFLSCTKNIFGALKQCKSVILVKEN